MLAILRDLVKVNLEFRIGLILVGIVVVLAGLSFVSPYPPNDVYVVAPDVPPGAPTGSAPPRAARTSSGR